MSEPEKAATGLSERWLMLGEVGVDSGNLGIHDPYMSSTLSVRPKWPKGRDKYATEWGIYGLAFPSGFGDGSYDVWARLVTYDTHDGPDERIAEVRIILVDEQGLAEWNELA